MTTIDDDDEECENAPDFCDNIMKIGTMSAALKTQKTYERRSNHSQKFRIIARSARHDPKVAMSFLATVCDHGSEIKLREVRLLVAIPNDQQALPPNPTLRGLVLLALKRQHPIYQYVAEQKGVAVVGYHEHYTFHHMMELVEYDPNWAAVRMVL